MEDYTINPVSENHLASLKGVTILVADDEDSSFRSAARILSNYEMKIIRACNGKEAFDIFTSNKDIKLILMDIKMPVMNGIVATKMIRTVDNQIPIVAISAFAMPGDRKIFQEAGCNEYLQKPLREDSLIKLIKSLV